PRSRPDSNLRRGLLRNTGGGGRGRALFFGRRPGKRNSALGGGHARSGEGVRVRARGLSSRPDEEAQKAGTGALGKSRAFVMIQSVRPATRLAGTVRLPGDKSISHRYALLAAIARGTSELRHFASSQDCRSTLDCLRGLGVSVFEQGETVTIEGRGLRGLIPPAAILDAGNSGTTIRLLSGILAGQPFEASITGDESLRRRPMGRILHPLRLMGASVECRDGELPPVKIHGGRLKGVRYSLPVASAQVKSCILLAGLYADSLSQVEEKIPTRDHTEIALRLFGARIHRSAEWIGVEPDPVLPPQSLGI